jgi:hypothetical protein
MPKRKTHWSHLQHFSCILHTWMCAHTHAQPHVHNIWPLNAQRMAEK